MKSNLLTVDIGNSNIKFGLFDGDSFKKNSIDTYPLLSSSSYQELVKNFIANDKIDGSIISSVVSSKYTELFINVLKSLSKGSPILVSHTMNTGLKVSVKEPQKLGTDRIVIAAAAYHYIKNPVAIIDFGTATTINVVDSNRRFLGGAIMPGINMMRHCLSEKTSELPIVELSNYSKPLGDDTKSSIISGILLGTAGAVNRIVDEIEKEIGCTLKVVITGGSANIVKNFLQRMDMIEPDLSIKGLKILYERALNDRHEDRKIRE